MACISWIYSIYSDSARHRYQDICPPISQIVLKNVIKISLIIKECLEEILIKLAIILKISKSSWNTAYTCKIVTELYSAHSYWKHALHYIPMSVILLTGTTTNYYIYNVNVTMNFVPYILLATMLFIYIENIWDWETTSSKSY